MAKKSESTKSNSVVVPADKARAAAEAVAGFEKTYGAGTVVKLGDKLGVQWPCTPTGIHSLDKLVIQAGGFPKGRIVEIYGPEAGGKTTLALTVIAQAQRAGEIAAIVDAEHALDPNYAAALGVDVGALFVSQPDYGEQALEITEGLIRSGGFGIVVVDSVAALTPKAEIEGEMGDSHMGLQARMMSQALRKLTSVVAKSGTTLVFINQIREKIGVMFGSPETTTGGRALKFYASLRLDVRRIASIKEGDVIVAGRTKIKAAKNKVGSPFRECEVTLLFGHGFDIELDLVEAGAAAGVVERSGSWFSFKGERLGQGSANAAEALRGNHDLRDSILSALNEELV